MSRALTPVAEVCSTLASPEMQHKLKQAMPPGVSIDRFTRVVLTAIQQNPRVCEGDRMSLYNSCVRAAQDGLLPDGREGALVTFRSKDGDKWIQKVQWMPMVAGILKRLAEAGITIDAQVVYENDDFEQELGDNASIRHKAPKLGTPRGNPLGAYAIARTREGLVFREVMDFEQIEQVRAASRAANDGPWASWWTEMARKTVIRRLAKRLPITDDRIQETITRDDALYDLNAAPPVDAAPPPAEPVRTRPRALQAVVDSTPEPEPAQASDTGDTAASATAVAGDVF